MLQCIYSIAFLCLLWFDEALKIKAHHIEVIDEARGEIKLMLPFRKTHQVGGIFIFGPALLTHILEIKPFHLFHNPYEPHVDPVHAILRWMYEARITEGYIFRRVTADDRLSAENRPLVGNVCNALTYYRARNCSVSISETICLMLGLTQVHTGHIHLEEGVVSICQVREDGESGSCVTGGDGVRISII